MSSLEVWKLISILATFAVAVLGMWISFYFRKSKLFPLGCALACGVLLAVGLTHSLPEGVEGMESWSIDNLNGYPFAYLLCAMAVAFLAIMEEGVHVWYKRKRSLSVHLCDGVPVKSPSDNLDSDKRISEPDMHSNVFSETSAIFVFLALSVHSILEGMATGVASGVDDLYGTLVAILAHKGLAAFALGANMVEARVSRYRVLLYGLIFAMGTPVGIIIGWLGSRGEESAGLFSGIANSLAAGTFIYVSVMEFFPVTFRHDRGRFIFKVVSFIAGFSLMAILPIWAEVHD
ncbi:Zinc transporter, putative [Perkinsus marinus ATCC 50983]|uniref:Zinc transporter, putative n=1 Tax=Perkinsus marinus (strain ATCC 50983 / TXsc) TaxID=423536 RepID=C5L3J9_PERM5|nr:Zinc transporter, putative [Perkinsus marinus ATCC 50983]EER08578.1 Zinc transporter, putative [Perkinsus marinus ATCC 50983]|eukprot:XP_002776762.1 Zinc transporter, putative [Perkinsus marinus ATCC 50983]